jgi:hypothetical protein
MQPDPIGTDGGINLDEYAGSDPINKSDPMGTNPRELGANVSLTNSDAIYDPTSPWLERATAWGVGYLTEDGVHTDRRRRHN